MGSVRASEFVEMDSDEQEEVLSRMDKNEIDQLRKELTMFSERARRYAQTEINFKIARGFAEEARGIFERIRSKK